MILVEPPSHEIELDDGHRARSDEPGRELECWAYAGYFTPLMYHVNVTGGDGFKVAQARRVVPKDKQRKVCL